MAKTHYRIAYGNTGYTNGCGAATLELAHPIYQRMKKMYPFCRLEEIISATKHVKPDHASK